LITGRSKYIELDANVFDKKRFNFEYYSDTMPIHSRLIFYLYKMRKTLSLLLFIASIALGCKKSRETPESVSNNSYQPVTKGSYWKYQDFFSGTAPRYSTITMTGDQIYIEARRYYKYQSVIEGVSNIATGYFHAENGVVMSGLGVNGGEESLFLNENAGIGETWFLKKAVSNAATGGVSYPVTEPTVTIVKLVEKGITHSVGGKSFKNVIHTKHMQQLSSGQTVDVHDYYIAKGVGMIERRSADGSGSLLVEYSIK
jgi:hypothetical protein